MRCSRIFLVLGFAVVVLVLTTFVVVGSFSRTSSFGRRRLFQYDPSAALSGAIDLNNTDWWRVPALLKPVLRSADDAYQRAIAIRDKKAASVKGGLKGWAKVALLTTPLYPCPLEFKFGDFVDGGKWVCLSHLASSKQSPVVVSIGSHGETSFEKAIYEAFGVHTHTFDFSLSRPKKWLVNQAKCIKLYEVGLAGSSEKESMSQQFSAKFIDIRQVLEAIEEAYVDIFKVDCEGCENAVVQDLANWYTRSTVPFGQIQMEVHNWKDETIDVLQGTLEALGYRLFHTEVNTAFASRSVAMFEVSYIHESLVVP